MRKWEQDIVVCIKRLECAAELLLEWLRTGGQYGIEIFDYLKIEGNDEWNLSPHPYLKMGVDEKRVFRQCYGTPLLIPKKLQMGITVQEFLKEMDKRKELFKETVSHTSQSRFRSFTRKNVEKGKDANNIPKKA